MNGSNGNGEAVVEIRKLWTVFESPDGDQVVHRDLDLTIYRGEVLSLVGGSGTGKTVLLRQILGLEHPDKGEVSVLGHPPGRMSATGAAQVGMLFQHGALFSAFSVLDNIAFPLRELKLLPEELIRDAALVKLQMVGLEPQQATKSPADLSGGMIAADLTLDIGPAYFMTALPRAVPLTNLWLAMGKSAVFGVMIALIACYFGMKVKPNTESLGRGTTSSVVASITVVILVDALFAVLFRGVGFRA